MLFYLKMQHGIAVDRAVFDAPMPDDWPGRKLWVEHPEAQIGWAYKDKVWTPPVVERLLPPDEPAE